MKVQTKLFSEIIALNSMVLIDRNICLSFLETNWRDKKVLLIFDNIRNKLVSSFNTLLQNCDEVVLEKLIMNFLNKNLTS